MQLVVELVQRHDDALDVLAFVELLLGLLIAFLDLHFDCHHLPATARQLAPSLPPGTPPTNSPSKRPNANAQTYLHIRRRQPRVCHNRRATIKYLRPRIRQSRLRCPHDQRTTHPALIPRLLAQLAHGRLLRRLALVDQAGGELDADGVDGRPVLQHDHGGRGFCPRGVAQNGRNGDGVDAAAASGFACGGFPGAVFAGLVGGEGGLALVWHRGSDGGAARAYLVDPLDVLDQLNEEYSAHVEWKRMYLNLSQLGPFGLFRRQRADLLDVWRRHFATARR